MAIIDASKGKGGLKTGSALRSDEGWIDSSNYDIGFDVNNLILQLSGRAYANGYWQGAIFIPTQNLQ